MNAKLSLQKDKPSIGLFIEKNQKSGSMGEQIRHSLAKGLPGSHFVYDFFTLPQTCASV